MYNMWNVWNVVERCTCGHKNNIEIYNSLISQSLLPMASGFAKGSRSANNLNQSDLSVSGFLRSRCLDGIFSVNEIINSNLNW